MGKFDKQIKDGLKIAEGWMKRSADDHEFFIGMKKNGIAWEKDAIKRIEGLIKDGEADKALGEIEESETWLKDYESQLKDRYKKHYDFIRGDPRDGAKGICNLLKIKEKDEAYKPVMEGTTKVLMQTTKQFQETEAAWKDDVEVRLKLLFSKLDTLKKLASGEEKEMTAYGKQIVKDLELFRKQVADILVNLKADQCEKDIQQMSTGNRQDFVGGNEKFMRDKYRMYGIRIEAIPKLIDVLEKNYNRILKSIPDEVKGKIMFARSLKTLELTKKKADTDLKAALGAFKMCKATFEKNFAELV